ncbi:MAG TPA: dethiobiotin synthase, partial [Longimicrobium sp.]|nr:dethiobiotin synthase [Longimicrobium sp.]
MIRIGVTGTDTGVGKTYLSTLLLAMMRRKGLNVAAMKPVETGKVGDDPTSDAARLREAAGAQDPLEHVRPVLLSEPLAPWVALARAGGPGVDVGRLDAAFHEDGVAPLRQLVVGAVQRGQVHRAAGAGQRHPRRQRLRQQDRPHQVDRVAGAGGLAQAHGVAGGVVRLDPRLHRLHGGDGEAAPAQHLQEHGGDVGLAHAR